MNVEKQDVDRNTIRRHAAAEVIELGEMLFDTAIDAAARQPIEGETSNAALIEEMQAAANEFFIALRLLLETEQASGEQNL
jgi:hypothetical protein